MQKGDRADAAFCYIFVNAVVSVIAPCHQLFPETMKIVHGLLHQVAKRLLDIVHFMQAACQLRDDLAGEEHLKVHPTAGHMKAIA